jgi:hypothetical protein
VHAAAGDQTKDPSQPSPDDRKVVDLGVLTIDKPVSDRLEAQKKLLFLPTRLADGIELSDDRLPCHQGPGLRAIVRAARALTAHRDRSVAVEWTLSAGHSTFAFAWLH